MAVLIKDRETEQLIRVLADRTGQGITEAVRQSVEERLARLDAKPGRVDWALLQQVLDEIRAAPRMNEHLTDDEIVGYNDQGHFD
jgi:antitoxin VapB